MKYAELSFLRIILLATMLLPTGSVVADQTQAKRLEPEGGAVTKLLFIHHSVGGHWLAHEYGGLVSELNRHGFYVNDITYGWQPQGVSEWKSRFTTWFGLTPQGADRIGDRTDIGHLYDWFLGPDSGLITDAAFRENNETADFGDHANASSAAPLVNPGKEIENEVIMIKPCYPNTLYRGKGTDPPTSAADPPRNFTAGAEQHTVANCKRIYNDILSYFASRPDKFFVIVTAPPRIELPEEGGVARAFSTWLARDWLRDNHYTAGNVMVFDLFNVLTSAETEGENDAVAGGNHHRLVAGEEQHQVTTANNLLVYPRKDGDNHPSPAGLRKATSEFTGLLVQKYLNWKTRQSKGVEPENE